MEGKILALFAARYPASAQRRGGRALRLRDWPRLLPDAFSSADARHSFLDAMERLERAGILSLHWKKRRVGDDLESADLIDAAALYGRLGLALPEEQAFALLDAAARAADGAVQCDDRKTVVFFQSIAARADSLAGRISPRDIEDIAAFFAFDAREAERLPIRALSIRLYADSKRLEALTDAFRSNRSADDDLDPFPVRSYPEAAIAGHAELLFSDGAVWPLGGRSISVPLTAAAELDAIRPPPGVAAPRALSVENKETFHAFVREPFGFDLIVCTGGRPNRCVRLLLRLLAVAGFTVHHAGDLDADGIAILAETAALCGARPLGMNRQVFDRYLPYARDLDPALVARLDGLPPGTLDLPGIAELVAAIRTHRKGVEQEIIDYAPLVDDIR